MLKYELKQNAHIWLLNITKNLTSLDFLFTILSKDEKQKVNKFKFEKDRTTSVIARGSLRHLLSKYLACQATEIKFSYGKYGKPTLLNNNTLKFNISHSGEIIVIAFCNDYDIGIDVEYIKRDFNVLEIVDNYFSNQEIRALHQIPKEQQTEAFFRGWTRKEAFIKAKSQGLSFPLDSFSISIDSDENATLFETAWDESEKNFWRIVPFETHIDYKAAFAVKGKIDDVKYFDFNLDYFIN